jgi:hypothetical protein
MDTYYVDTNLDNNVSVVHSHVGGYSIYLPVMWRQSPYGGRQFLYGERQSSYRQSQ